MDIITIQKFVHTSPRKLRLVVDMVRKLQPNKALEILNFTPKAAAKEVSGAIKVALGNAKQLGLDGEKTVFKKIEVNEGPKAKRIRAGARGRAKPYIKRMSHIKIVLTDDVNIKSEISKLKTEKVIEKTEKKEST